jgi:glycine dehydrogenase
LSIFHYLFLFKALLANISAMFAVYHGPKGLEEIARRVHSGTLLLAKGLREEGNDVETKLFFDTIKVVIESP